MEVEEYKIDFFRKLVNHLEGRFPFVEYQGLHYNNMGGRNGMILHMFGDQWTFYMCPSKDYNVYCTITMDFLKKPKEDWQVAMSDYWPMKIEEISDFIYHFYFESVYSE